MSSETTSSQDPAKNKTLTAQCHCKSVHFSIRVPLSSLPLPFHLCHCHICRRTHGSFSCFHAPMPATIQPEFIAPSSLAVCTGYAHGVGAASTRFFCSTCGCHIGDRDVVPDEHGQFEWRVATSIFPSHDQESSFRIGSHFFADGEPGPGLHTWLPSINSQTIKRITPPEGDETFPLPRPDPPPVESHPDGHDRLRAECHCGGVSFTLPRPTHPTLAGNPFVARYVSTVDPAKWVACLDVCDDCRLVTGSHVIGWTFVPLASLEPAVTPGLEGFGTLKKYNSSEGVTRGFCGVCGATVFFVIDDPERVQPEEEGGCRIVDIAIGVLRDPEGPAAEGWVTWRTGRVAFAESGRRFDNGFTEGLERGLREWGVQRDGKALDFSIP